MADAGALAPVVPFDDPSRKRRLVKVVAWLVGIALVVVVLNLLGVDVRGWLSDLWDQIKAVPARYIVAALVFQTGQTVLCRPLVLRDPQRRLSRRGGDLPRS